MDLMIKNVRNKFGFARIALVTSVGFPFVVASNAFAQTAPARSPASAAAPPAPAAEVERVIVTGSLIPTAEEVAANPAFSLNRDLINKSGAGTTTEQLLQRQPVMNGSNIPVNNNGTSQSGPSGSAALALRGLDPGATLVLIDRRGVAPFPGAANSGYGYVDLTTIPITAVPWNLQLQTAAIIAAGGTPFDPTLTKQFGTPPDNANGLVPASDYIYFSSRPRAPFSILPGFNFNLYSSSYPEQERWGGYAAYEHKICDDQLRLFGDFYYVDAKTHDELAPIATGSFELPGSPTLYIPPREAFTGEPPFGGPTYAEVGAPVGAFNPWNPFEQIISGGSRARIFDFGNRLIDNENVAERFTVGVKGDKLFNGTWGYDGAFMYSQVQQIAKLHSVNGPRFERILNANDPLFDPTSTQFIGQTVPYNPFVDTQHVVFPSNLPLTEIAM